MENRRETLLLQITGQLNHMTAAIPRGPKSAFRKVLLGTDNVRGLAKLILDHTIKAISKGTGLTTAAEGLAIEMNKLTTVNLRAGSDRKVKYALISAGVEAFGSLKSLRYIDKVTERQGVMKLNKLDFLNEDNLLFYYFEEQLTISELELPKEDYTYWTHPRKDGRTIVKKMPKSLASQYTYTKMPGVYIALNAYGSTKFRVNEELIPILLQMDKNKHMFIPKAIDSEVVSEALYTLMKFQRISQFVGEQAKKWYLANVSQQLMKKGLTTVQIDGRSKKYSKRKASGWFKEKTSEPLDLVRASSKRYEFDKVNFMAQRMCGKTFHYDFQLDSRGRMYPIVNYFEPSGSDLAKGLLIFKDGVPVSDNVLYNLAVHTANCMGEDKLAMEDRVLFVWVHMDEILEAAEDLANSEWLNQFKDEKKSKFQLMAAVLEWKKYHEQGEDYVCHLPIGLDATNSGLQVLSAVTRDTIGAQETNVINHPDQEIGDAYMVIANSVLERGFAYKNYEDLGNRAWRKLCKRPTMSYYYDAGRECIQEQTYDDRRDHGFDVLSEMTFDDASYVGTAIYDGVESAFPRQTQAKEALKLGVEEALRNNGGKALVTWRTASGFTAFQDYSRIEAGRVNCSFAGKLVQLSFQLFTDKPMKSDHTKGISANFVHSQDAALLSLTIANLYEKGIESFMMIHDQFSVNAEETSLLLETFKETFIEIFEKDQLGNTLRAFGLDTNPVSYGDLDIQNVAEAKYIIS